MSEKLVNKINTCRVCLESIYSDYIDLSGTMWLELYEYCFGLTLSENDVPRKLCSKCAERMQEFANFKRKCYHSDQLWKSIINHNLIETEVSLNENKLILHVKEEKDVKETNTFLESSKIDVKIETNNDFEAPPSFDECDKTNEPERPKGKNTRKYKKCKKKPVIQKKSIETISAKNVKIPCGLCDFISNDTEAMKQHLEAHKTNNNLNCKLCNYEGRDFADMINHRYDHYPEYIKQTKEKKCYLCEQSFGNAKLVNFKRRLEFHYRSEHLNKNGGWCTVCNKTFSRYKTFWIHVQLHDKDTKKFICDHCGKAFLYRSEIASHFDNEKDKICDFCGRTFKRLSNLKAHISTVHVNVPMKCNHCDLTFKNEQRLKDHLKKLDKKKEFVCKICSKAFYTSRHLKLHEFWHTGERPHPCDICGKKYKNKSQLAVHIKRHRGICEFKCSDCPKVFVTSTQLKVHTSVHTGVRRHKCSYCERSFNQRKLLIVHCSTKHNIDNIDFTRKDMATKK